MSYTNQEDATWVLAQYGYIVNNNGIHYDKRDTTEVFTMFISWKKIRSVCWKANGVSLLLWSSKFPDWNISIKDSDDCTIIGQYLIKAFTKKALGETIEN